MGPRSRFPGMKSASLCSLAGRYDNPIPSRFLVPIDCLKIPAQGPTSNMAGGYFRKESKFIISTTGGAQALEPWYCFLQKGDWNFWYINANFDTFTVSIGLKTIVKNLQTVHCRIVSQFQLKIRCKTHYLMLICSKYETGYFVELRKQKHICIRGLLYICICLQADI